MGGAGPFQWMPDLKRWYPADRDRKRRDKKEIFFTHRAADPAARQVQGHLGRQGRHKQAAPRRRVHDLHRGRARARDLSEHPQEGDPRRQAVHRGTQGQCRDPIRLDRVSSKGSRRSSPRQADRPAHGRSWRRRLNIRFAKLMRWLHIYVSMFGLAAVLFFSVTGITLNHPDWFFGECRAAGPGRGPGRPEMAARGHAGSGRRRHRAGEPDRSERSPSWRSSSTCARRTAVRGALADFRVDESECMVSFKGPGYAADAFIDRESGHYNLTQTSHGFIAVINDLHKGRDTGPVWSAVIDISAVVLTVISLTGLILLFYLKLRRGPGLVVSLIGAAVVVAICLLLGAVTAGTGALHHLPSRAAADRFSIASYASCAAFVMPVSAPCSAGRSRAYWPFAAGVRRMPSERRIRRRSDHGQGFRLSDVDGVPDLSRPKGSRYAPGTSVRHPAGHRVCPPRPLPGVSAGPVRCRDRLSRAARDPRVTLPGRLRSSGDRLRHPEPLLERVVERSTGLRHGGDDPARIDRYDRLRPRPISATDSGSDRPVPSRRSDDAVREWDDPLWDPPE